MCDWRVVLRYLRRLEEMPDHTDQLFVVDRYEQLKGVLLINRLLVSDPDTLVADVMTKEMIKLHPDDVAQQAANAFERYDLVSASVVDDTDKLLGRVTVNTVIDFIRDKAENEALNLAGLSGEEDLFAPVLKSVKNRWVWLAINLVTAFIASRVIGVFRKTPIETGRPRSTYADYRRHWRQFRQPNHHHDRTRTGTGSNQHQQRMEINCQGNRRQRSQRPVMGSRGRSVYLRDLSKRRTGSGHDPGANAEFAAGSTARCINPTDTAQIRA